MVNIHHCSESDNALSLLPEWVYHAHCVCVYPTALYQLKWVRIAFQTAIIIYTYIGLYIQYSALPLECHLKTTNLHCLPSAVKESMNSVVVLLAIFSLTVGQDILADTWHSWRERYRKVYSSAGEAARRQQIWMRNFEKISSHNSRNHSYSVNLNQFADFVSQTHYPPTSCI